MSGAGPRLLRLLLVSVGLLAVAPAVAQERPAPEAPGAAAGGPKAAEGSRHMVVAAHPLAAGAARDVLRRGGSALDAVVAAQFVLNLVEPQSSGIGGGGFLLYAPAGDRPVSYDGRETAPAAATPDRVPLPGGTPLPIMTAGPAGLSVGGPGLVAMLELAHAKHGRLPWRELAAPAERLARDGFPVGERLAGLIAGDAALGLFAAARGIYFHADGRPLQPGDRLANPALADTLAAIGAGGAAALHRGPLAAAVVAAIGDLPLNAGDMTVADLAGYRAVERPAVCAPYRTVEVCGMGPPSSGGVAVAQILGILERFDMAALAPLSAEAAHLFAEAGRLAFADRAVWLADPAFADVPVAGLVEPDYVARQSALVDPEASRGRAEAGEPRRRAGLRPAASEPRTLPGTTHVSVVDADGNAASLTSSIESAFGSRLVVGGFLLNNQLTDFAFVPARDGVPVANRVEAGKRPLSSMSPTIVLDRASGRPLYALGSPGGSRIINYVARAVVALVDWRMTPAEAAALPHYGSRNGPTELEAGTAAAGLADGLRALRHEVRTADMTSGLHIVAIRDGRLLGGADPRREGVVLAD